MVMAASKVLLAGLLLSSVGVVMVQGFVPAPAWVPSRSSTCCSRRSSDVAVHSPPLPTVLYMSEWGGFQAMDDDDEIVFGKKIDTNEYAVENDDPEIKAQVGANREAPEIDDPRRVDAIMVPAGSQLELDEDTVLGVLQAAREELGTLFGYSAENRGVGITGGVDYVEMDGPTVVVRLKGRFWHQRTTVLDRVSNYLTQRIPEIIDVSVEDPWQVRFCNFFHACNILFFIHSLTHLPIADCFNSQLTDEANEIW